MPQQRQRIVFCDCLDCVQQPPTTDIAACISSANEAAARQEPPPKCLAFVLSGVLLPRPARQDGSSCAETVLDTCNLPHLNRATAQGNLCLLTLREASTSDAYSELAQVLNMYEEYEQHTTPTTLADRFKAMQASFSSNNSNASKLATAVGMSSSCVLDTAGNDADGTTNAAADAFGGSAGLPSALIQGAAASSKHGGGRQAGSSEAGEATAAVAEQLPDPAEAARRILQELGLQQADAGLDMLMVHVDTSSIINPQQQQQQAAAISQSVLSAQPSAAAAVAAAVLTWLDRTLRYLNNSIAFKDAVLLTVLATPGPSKLPADVPMLAAAGGTLLDQTEVLYAAPSGTTGGQQQQQQQQQQEEKGHQQGGAAAACPAATINRQKRKVLKPLQSWEQLAGQHVAISKQRVMLCLRRLPGVIRRDECLKFSLEECCSNSGSLGLLSDRLIPEIAYKLGRAPKYGA